MTGKRLTAEEQALLDLVRGHHQVETRLNDAEQGTYRSHVGILLGIIDGLTALPDEDDEQFCPRCFAGVESSEHATKCVELGWAHDGEPAPAGAPSWAQFGGPRLTLVATGRA
jgi:hypothetical protein